MCDVTCEHEVRFNLLTLTDCCALFSVLVMVLVRHILVSLIGLTVTLRVFFTCVLLSVSLTTLTRLTLMHTAHTTISGCGRMMV